MFKRVVQTTCFEWVFGLILGDMGELQHLVILDLSINKFVGWFSKELKILLKFSKLDLSFNKLSGIVPHSLG